MKRDCHCYAKCICPAGEPVSDDEHAIHLELDAWRKPLDEFPPVAPRWILLAIAITLISIVASVAFPWGFA